jgi:Protein of unknown function (DUF2889)
MTENLTSNNNSRKLVHERKIDLKAYRREDNLWDIEAEIIDTKTRDFQLVALQRKAGEPIHRMMLTLTIDDNFNIVDANAKSFEVPYVGSCDQIAPDYAKLIGLNLLDGFKNGVKSRLGGIQGCTHITELTKLIPTVAIQAFVGEVFQIQLGATEKKSPNEELPFHFNGCHALRTDREVVKKYHPVWYGHPLEPGKFTISKK